MIEKYTARLDRPHYGRKGLPFRVDCRTCGRSVIRHGGRHVYACSPQCAEVRTEKLRARAEKAARARVHRQAVARIAAATKKEKHDG